ncbi:MAG: 16S rRNA processing protein RimM [Anaerolineae bacterium]|nr:16S rRNA processing protein RimM [Anaerolineae bacterium]
MPEQTLMIGRIVKPWGIKGEVEVEPESDWPPRFSGLKQVHLGDGLTGVTIEGVRRNRDRVVLKLAGIETRNAAESLSGQWLHIPATQAMPLGEGEYFIHDVLGAAVWTPAGEELGTITEVMTGLANDVWVVRGGQGEILIPAIRDVVQEVNLDTRHITVVLPPGLIP